jgi:hypothetical protein
MRLIDDSSECNFLDNRKRRRTLPPTMDRPYPLAGEQTGRCATAALAVLRSTHETRILRRLQTG